MYKGPTSNPSSQEEPIDFSDEDAAQDSWTDDEEVDSQGSHDPLTTAFKQFSLTAQSFQVNLNDLDKSESNSSEDELDISFERDDVLDALVDNQPIPAASNIPSPAQGQGPQSPEKPYRLRDQLKGPYAKLFYVLATTLPKPEALKSQVNPYILDTVEAEKSFLQALGYIYYLFVFRKRENIHSKMVNLPATVICETARGKPFYTCHANKVADIYNLLQKAIREQQCAIDTLTKKIQEHPQSEKENTPLIECYTLRKTLLELHGYSILYALSHLQDSEKKRKMSKIINLDLDKPLAFPEIPDSLLEKIRSCHPKTPIRTPLKRKFKEDPDDVTNAINTIRNAGLPARRLFCDKDLDEKKDAKRKQRYRLR